MAYSMNLNDITSDEIFKLNSSLIPPGFQGDVRKVRLMQESLGRIIDELGQQSASVQGLNRVITSAEKLRNSPNHTLYLLKDACANSGRGDLIGLLKVGRKHLFLFDERAQVREVEPLCVLDFYVQRDRQRHGYGKMLFDYMLKDQGLQPHELAIDGPSSKMEFFLAKSYNIDKLIRQNNNFAVAPLFFTRHADDIRPVRSSRINVESAPRVLFSASGRQSTPLSPAIGRFAAHPPPSAIANVIHGGGGASPFPDSNRRTPAARTFPALADLPRRRVYDVSSSQRIIHGCERGGAEEPVDRGRDVLCWGLTEQLVHPPAEHEQLIPERDECATQPDPEPDTEPDAGAVAAAMRPRSLAVTTETPAAGMPSAGATPSSNRRDSQLTDKGYFDVKFYHNKLW